MTEITQIDDEVGLRRYDYDDETVFVADFGPAGDAAVDIVDDTAIVVVGDEQYDLDLPAGDAQAFMKNGVLSIEVRE